MVRIRAVVPVFLMAVSALLIAAEPTAPVQDEPPNTAPVTSTPIAAPDERAIQLQEQLLVMKARLESELAFQSDVLSTVYFSLSIVAGLAIVLIGYNWFTNYRIYQREKETLKRELATDLSSQALEERRRTDAELSQIRAELTEAAKACNEHATAASRVERETAVSELTKKIDALKASSERKDRSLSIRLARAAVQTYIGDKDYTMAATYGIRLLEEALATETDVYVETALRILEECIDNEGFFTQSEKERLAQFLKDVPTDLRDSAEGLEKKLPAIKLLGT